MKCGAFLAVAPCLPFSFHLSPQPLHYGFYGESMPMRAGILLSPRSMGSRCPHACCSGARCDLRKKESTLSLYNSNTSPRGVIPL